MTARQRSELQSVVSPVTSVARVGLYFVAVGLVGLVLRGLQASFGLKTEIPFWMVPTLILGGLLYVRGGRWTGGPELRGKIRQDLERGEVIHHRVRVVDALEAPEVEDEGPVFFLVEEDGATLFFAGQELARYKRRGFPWAEFEIIISPVTGQFFKLRSLGDSFLEVRQRAPLSFSEGKALGVSNANFGVLEMSLEELEEEG